MTLGSLKSEGLGSVEAHKQERDNGLPEVWRAAYQRDRQGSADYADPAPERKAARALAAYILVGLGFLALPGTVLGVWNLIAIAAHRATGAASVAWIQAHGQAQLFGWVGTFILGISLYTLPKFRGRPLRSFGAVWVIWALWTAGVTWRWWVGFSGTSAWRLGLVASAVLEVAAYALSQYVLVFRPGDKGKGQRAPSDLGSWLGIVAFGALGVALMVNLGIALSLALHGSSPVYPPGADRMFLLVALWGFVVPAAWGYSTRFVTIFLGLEQPEHLAARWLSSGVVALVVAALARQFWLADLLALALTPYAMWALRVFRPPVRAAKLAAIYRGYPAFVRIAYGWLIAGAGLGLLADLVPRLAGLGGASRHAITVGFVATLIFAIGPRILPAFLAGRELYSFRLMAASLWILTLGCFIRVSSESFAYSAGAHSGSGLAWTLLPISALLELTAVITFVANLGMTLTQAPPAWLSPEGVNSRLPVYWFVTSFPETKAILIEAGVKTLARVKEPPRSLSLADAAAADGADIEQTLDRLRRFFIQRQPRHQRAG